MQLSELWFLLFSLLFPLGRVWVAQTLGVLLTDPIDNLNILAMNKMCIFSGIICELVFQCVPKQREEKYERVQIVVSKAGFQEQRASGNEELQYGNLGWSTASFTQHWLLSERLVPATTVLHCSGRNYHGHYCGWKVIYGAVFYLRNYHSPNPFFLTITICTFNRC